MTKDRNLFKISEAAEILGIEKRTLRYLVEKRRVPVTQFTGFSGKRYLTLETVQALERELRSAVSAVSAV